VDLSKDQKREQTNINNKLDKLIKLISDKEKDEKEVTANKVATAPESPSVDQLVELFASKGIETIGDLLGPTGADLSQVGKQAIVERAYFNLSKKAGAFISTYLELTRNHVNNEISALELKFNLHAADASELREFMRLACIAVKKN